MPYRRAVLVLAFVSLVSVPARAQAAADTGVSRTAPADTGAAAFHRTVDWQNRFVAYGDNTEFFSQFRTGETLLGVQFWSYFSYRPDPRIELQAGVFGNHQLGSPDFFVQTHALLPHGDDTTTYSPLRPVLSLRYHGAHSLGVMGMLETDQRHGMIEPLQVMQMDITRPVEYGVQWIERRPGFHGEMFLNWQHLNTPTSREIFDYGLVVRKDLAPWLAIEGQLHGKHHGGQLYNIGVVANNHAGAIGVRLSDSLPVLGKSELAYFRLGSDGYLDTLEAKAYPDKGYGNYFRGKVSPGGVLDIVGIVWTGHGFHSEEGDNHYNSIGWDPTYFKLDRFYAELGFLKRFHLKGDVTIDTELRLHQIDRFKSIAIGGVSFEYSYRIIGTVPLSVRLLTR